MKRLLLLCFLLLSLNAKSQSILYVDSSVAASGSGTSWASAYKTLNEAFNVANAGSTAVKYVINVAGGTYYTTGVQSGTNRDSAFFITRGGVKVYGGYPTGGGVRAVAGNPTIISGNIGAVGSSADNSYHVMVVAGITATADSVVVDGVTIRDGYASGTTFKNYAGLPVQRYRGAGIFTTSIAVGKLIINNCTFTADTTVGGDGGGMYNIGAAPIVSNCTFLGNAAPGQGGGGLMCASLSSPTVSNCVFSGNTSAFGAALYNNRGSSSAVRPTISNCIFSGNVATGDGGAIYDVNSSANPSLITGCTFLGNSGVNGGALYSGNTGVTTTGASLLKCSFNNNVALAAGGAVYNTGSGGSYIIDSCTFTSNKAGNAGGGLYNSFVASSTAGTVSHCTFTADSAGLGGGIYNISNNSTYSNCTFSGNKAAYGAGMYSYSSNTGIIRNSVFSGNMALTAGGGLMNHIMASTYKETNNLFSGNTAGAGGGAVYDSAASPAIANCTFAGDSALIGNGIYNTTSSAPAILNCIVWEGTGNSIYNTSSSAPAVTYSTVQGGYTGTGNSSSDPLFVLAISAGLAPTSSGDYRLMACSPAINTGNNSGSYTGVLDAGGNARLFGSTVDRGAYEYQGTYPVPITGNSSVCVNGTVQLGNVLAGGAWSSSNTSIATVSASGLVTGIAAGTDTITYSLGTGVCPNTVSKIITINPLPIVGTISGNANVCIGSSATLGNSTVGGTWISSNTAIAAISGIGLVSGVALGIDTITYTVVNANGCSSDATKVITVSPYPVVAAISGNAVVCAGDTTSLSDSTVGGTWNSSNSVIASVSAGGVVSGVTAGNASIIYTVTNSGGCASQAVKTITVNGLPVVAAITGAGSVCITGNLQLSDTIRGGVWSSSNTGVASIDTAGIVTPVMTGSTNIIYTVTNTNGCVGYASKLLTIAPMYFHNVRASTCRGTTYAFGGQLLDSAGIYTHKFQSVSGCDSNVSLTLSIDTIDVSVTQTGNQLVANQAGATYQWIDCGNGNRQIAGENLQTFTANQDGQYAVVLGYNSCTDTSMCYTVSGMAVNSVNGLAGSIRIYPNPSTGVFTVISGKELSGPIIIRDIAGRQLMSVTPSGQKTRMDMTAYAPGIYMVEGRDRNTIYVGRLIIAR